MPMADQGLRIEVRNLVKRFGAVAAVNDISFSVPPGRVTGFLGPNGAGKTTTLRCLLGLVRPTSGTATIGGKRYHDLPDPIGTVGAALEASSFHPGRTARNHLKVIAAGAGLPLSRVDRVLELVSLADVADRRVLGYSMGMRQRLALAAALLGDPGVLILDEPANGLDPAGIAWLRTFLRGLAEEGRTVLISSHVLNEVQQTVDDVLILARGRLVRQGPLADLDDPAQRGVLVSAPDVAALGKALAKEGLPEPQPHDGLVRVVGVPPSAVGKAAFKHRIELHELYRESSHLETIFLQLTTDDGGQP